MIHVTSLHREAGHWQLHIGTAHCSGLMPTGEHGVLRNQTTTAGNGLNRKKKKKKPGAIALSSSVSRQTMAPCFRFNPKLEHHHD
jgi:hypothetical protein